MKQEVEGQLSSTTFQQQDQDEAPQHPLLSRRTLLLLLQERRQITLLQAQEHKLLPHQQCNLNKQLPPKLSITQSEGNPQRPWNLT
jgi:hypothetical protein